MFNFINLKIDKLNGEKVSYKFGNGICYIFIWYRIYI